MPIEPIKRKNITDEIFRQMRQLILSGEWNSGSKIPSENELTDRFGVSRIAVREALKKLLALDLIETRPGSGTYVKELSAGLYANSLIPLLLLDKPNVRHVIEFRRAIEVENARLATERATGEDIENLQKILDQMEQSVGDSEKFAEKDSDFHYEIAKMTRNPFIIKVTLLLKDIMYTAMTDTTATLGYDGIVKHKEILEAIKGHNSQKARRLMRGHFDHTLKQLDSPAKKRI